MKSKLFERTCTSLELEKFKDANKDELSMIEVAHEILHQRGETMAFVDLTNEIQVYLGKSDEEIRDRLAQFYTDLNIDGSFISLGDNVWGLRSWYPYDSIDEALVHGETKKTRNVHVRNVRKLTPSWPMFLMMMMLSTMMTMIQKMKILTMIMMMKMMTTMKVVMN